MEDLLSHAQREKYDRLRGVVKEWMDQYWEACRALIIIQEERLYREKYDTFEDFCRRELRMDRSFTTRMIQAVKEVDHLSGSAKPSSERVARELVPVPKPMKQPVWNKAIEMSPNGKPTYATVKKAVLELVPDGRQQRMDREFLEQLRAANRLIKGDVYLAESPNDVVAEAIGLVRQIEVKLKALKMALNNRSSVAMN